MSHPSRSSLHICFPTYGMLLSLSLLVLLLPSAVAHEAAVVAAAEEAISQSTPTQAVRAAAVVSVVRTAADRVATIASPRASSQKAAASSPDRPAARPCQCHAPMRPQDQIWLIDARDASTDCACVDYRPPLGYDRYTDERKWQRADLNAFLAEDQATTLTLFWVHGNRVDPLLAKCRGLTVYRTLLAESDDERPIRFVIFSWPSSKVRGPLNDLRLKARRTVPAGCQLAWLVDHVDAETSIGMIGFSFGARVITEALHVLGGGKVDGVGLDERKHPERRSIRVVLAAAALDDDWLLPGCRHDKALSQVERMLLLNNHCDRAMRWYGLVERRGRPRALGRYGLTSLEVLGEDAAKIEQFDVGRYVGRMHDFTLYFDCPGLMSTAWSTLAGDQDN